MIFYVAFFGILFRVNELQNHSMFLQYKDINFIQNIKYKIHNPFVQNFQLLIQSLPLYNCQLSLSEFNYYWNYFASTCCGHETRYNFWTSLFESIFLRIDLTKLRSFECMETPNFIVYNRHQTNAQTRMPSGWTWDFQMYLTFNYYNHNNYSYYYFIGWAKDEKSNILSSKG